MECSLEVTMLLRKKVILDEMATITERYRKNGKMVFWVVTRIKDNKTLSKNFCKR